MTFHGLKITNYLISCTFPLVELAIFMMVETELPCSNSSLNEEDLASYVILEALVCNVFIEFNYSVVVENLRKRAVTKQ